MEFMIGLQEAATTTVEASASNWQLAGAMGFGMVIGWYVYYVNRYRQGEVQFSDLATLISIIGGGAILTLFPASTDLFGAYGLGLAIGFFLYFVVLVGFVRSSPKFTVEWFLDGRRGKIDEKTESYGILKEEAEKLGIRNSASAMNLSDSDGDPRSQ